MAGRTISSDGLRNQVAGLGGELRELGRLLKQPHGGGAASLRDCTARVDRLRAGLSSHVERAGRQGFLSSVRRHRPELRPSADQLHDRQMKLLDRCERLVGELLAQGDAAAIELRAMRDQMIDLVQALDGLQDDENRLVQAAFDLEPSATE